MPLNVGDIPQVKVTGITKFGAFVALPGGGSGMIHISEISCGFVKDIHDHLKEGDVMPAVVISNANGKISLSLKKLETDKPVQAKPPKSDIPPEFSEISRVSSPSSFEDMMSHYKASCDDKFSSLKNIQEPHHTDNTRHRQKGK